jgi:hypothetical protein
VPTEVPAYRSGWQRMPRGIITLWYGRVLDIPKGWQLCNGTNGTPDLRNKMPAGAYGDSSQTPQGMPVTSITGSMTFSGGSSIHAHSVTTSAHSHTGLTSVETASLSGDISISVAFNTYTSYADNGGVSVTGYTDSVALSTNISFDVNTCTGGNSTGVYDQGHTHDPSNVAGVSAGGDFDAIQSGATATGYANLYDPGHSHTVSACVSAAVQINNHQHTVIAVEDALNLHRHAVSSLFITSLTGVDVTCIHQHSYTTPTSASSVLTTTAGSSLMPYLALAYIMKMSR